MVSCLLQFDRRVGNRYCCMDYSSFSVEFARESIARALESCARAVRMLRAHRAPPSRRAMFCNVLTHTLHCSRPRFTVRGNETASQAKHEPQYCNCNARDTNEVQRGHRKHKSCARSTRFRLGSARLDSTRLNSTWFNST